MTPQFPRFRRELLFLCLLMAFAASVLYDTLFIIPLNTMRSVVAVAVFACFGAAFLLARYPGRIVQPVLVAAWPLHLFTICLLGVSWCVHEGAESGTIIAYTIVAYATYLVLPLCLLLDRRLFEAFVKMVAIAGALLAIPSFIGALGIDSILGIPLSNKYAYSSFSGIIASGGIFEHGEGHALQMAVSVFCCFYAMRKSGNILLYGSCLMMVLAGLVISQGRGPLFGMVIAGAFCLLPELFRRSAPLFVGILAVCLLLPFLIWPQLSRIPGVSDYLRMERGLSGRDVAWQYAGSLVEEKPWTGHGFGTSGDLSAQGRKLLRRSGYSGAGTTFHNTFITKAVELGIPAAIVYTLLYLVPLVRICRPTSCVLEQQLVRNIIIMSLTASLFRDYNIGGVRSTAVMVAVFLGLANLWTATGGFDSTPKNSAGDEALPDKPADLQAIIC